MSNYGYSQSRQHSQGKKNWKHTFYPLDKKGKKIFQNFTQYMHFKFIRTRWISDDCQGKNLWIRCKRGLQWHQVFRSFCLDETILWNKMQRLQSCCLGIEINRVHEVEGQKAGPYLGFFVCGGKLGFREISDQYSYKKQPSKIRHYVRKKTFSFPGGGNCPLRPPAMYGPEKTQICLPLYGELKSNSCTIIRTLVIKNLWAKCFSESKKKKLGI